MKWDWDKTIKYLAQGAGAIVVPGFVSGTAFAGTLAGLPMWTTAIPAVQGVTVGGIVLASVGVGLVDMLFFSK